MTMREVICRLMGHRWGGWKQHHKEWRLFHECSRCSEVETMIKPDVAEKVSDWLASRGYPESAKLMRKRK